MFLSHVACNMMAVNKKAPEGAPSPSHPDENDASLPPRALQHRRRISSATASMPESISACVNIIRHIFRKINSLLPEMQLSVCIGLYGRIFEDTLNMDISLRKGKRKCPTTGKSPLSQHQP